MVVRMRHTRAHTRNRRSHHALKGPRLTVSKAGDAPRPRHRALLDGSPYRGRSVMDMVTKRIQKRQKAAGAAAKTDTKAAEEKAVKSETREGSSEKK